MFKKCVFVFFFVFGLVSGTLFAQNSRPVGSETAAISSQQSASQMMDSLKMKLTNVSNDVQRAFASGSAGRITNWMTKEGKKKYEEHLFSMKKENLIAIGKSFINRQETLEPGGADQPPLGVVNFSHQEKTVKFTFKFTTKPGSADQPPVSEFLLDTIPSDL
ncbi:MAG: hypothetical protein HQM08_26010 [Candidatus Riflebacteria bacterium]|nr:hypothetical protein [Candidatus Riflebacteria bacterium]